jgi:hypothetical protein
VLELLPRREVVKSLVALTSPLLLVVLCGCGASWPTERDVDTYIRQEIEKDHKPVNLVSLHKTNGQKSVDRGVRNYKLEFEGEIVFTEDCYWAFGLSFEKSFVHHGDLVSTEQTKKGDRARIQGTVKYEETDNGWRVHSLDFNGFDYNCRRRY